MTQTIPISLIRAETDAQPRGHINRDKVGEYAEAMALGDDFPPLVVFFDGLIYWLADGFHRLHAAIGNGFDGYPCDVHEGTRRDAILFSVGANATHGYPRTNDDKRRSVRRLLMDAEWRGWSDRDIARRCRVGYTLVATMRSEMDTARAGSMDRTFIHHKTGEPTTMKTGLINAGRPGNMPAEALPLVDLPMKSQEEIDRQNLFDFQNDLASNAFIASRLWDIEKFIKSMPAPDEAAANFPEPLLHSFSPERATVLAAWLLSFASAFEHRKGTQHVEAAQ